MKLSESTLAILNNFQRLNKSILFYPGHTIKNLSSDRSVFMTATIEEEIPRKFAVFNLLELLQVISAINDADIDFRDDHLFVSNPEHSVVFRYASPEVVTDVYSNKINTTNPAFEIPLSVEQIKKLFKMSGYLDIKDVKVVPSSDGAKIVLYNSKGSHAHNYTINTPIQVDLQNTITFSISALDVLDMNYKLAYYPSPADKPMKDRVQLAGVDRDVVYYLPCSRI